MVMAILAILVWKFATGIFIYPGIIFAVLITAGVFFLVFRSPGIATAKAAVKNNEQNEEIQDTGELEIEVSDENTKNSALESKLGSTGISIEPDITDISSRKRIRAAENPFRSIKNTEIKPDATEIAAKYMKMNGTADKDSGFSAGRPVAKISSPLGIGKAANSLDADVKSEESLESEDYDSEKGTSTPPVPLIEDESSLTEDEKNELVNAVWYRCENPYCKYTRFLSVHHMVDEKDGGSNKLDNLIVFCPYCHDLAHRNEIPEKEMREWISNREERFKFKPKWHYF